MNKIIKTIMLTGLVSLVAPQGRTELWDAGQAQPPEKNPTIEQKTEDGTFKVYSYTYGLTDYRVPITQQYVINIFYRKGMELDPEHPWKYMESKGFTLGYLLFNNRNDMYEGDRLPTELQNENGLHESYIVVKETGHGLWSVD